MSTDTTSQNGSAADIPQQTTTTTTRKTPATDATTAPKATPETYRKYQPEASTDAVRKEIVRSMATIVTEALHQATNFVYLADVNDRDGINDVTRHGHLVDATECMEIAFTHLSMLKSAASYRAWSQTAQNADADTVRYWPTDDV